jgi:hypothetical protein
MAEIGLGRPLCKRPAHNEAERLNHEDHEGHEEEQQDPKSFPS